jgi:hypothetical protein
VEGGEVSTTALVFGVGALAMILFVAGYLVGVARACNMVMKKLVEIEDDE